MIIGVTGTLGAGKDTISDYLQKRGYFHFSLSDAIRAECDKRGLPKDRDTLTKLANELRAEEGYDTLAKRALEAIKKSNAKNVVITSIRNPKEVQYLKNQDKFLLIAVDAPIELRYKRITERQREGDQINFEKFKKQEEREMAGGAGKQNLRQIIQMANHVIINNKTFENFYEKIKNILKNY
tara:strand:- start:17 stop:562 length:546 start_codon:yes stop_codon:yes gene_type:complete